MATISLTTIADGVTAIAADIRNNFNAIATAINGGLDNTNISNSAAISLSKLASDPTGKPLALTGAVSATRYVGGTAAVAPTTGTFAIGDFVVTQTGLIYACTVAGTPGTWVQVGTSNNELDSAQVTANAAGITATTEGTAVAIVTGNSITYDGTKNRVEFQCHWNPSTGIQVTFVLFRDAVVIGQEKILTQNVGTPQFTYGVAFDTPSAGAHTYKVSAFVNTGTLTPNAGAGGSGNLVPSFIRVTKA